MPIKILLLDDHQVFSSSLKMVLETNNYEVYSVTEVSFAVKLIKANTYDLIISDIEMPDINGVEFIKEIYRYKKQLKKTPKIIVLTSYNKLTLFKKLYSLGIDGYLNKNTTQFELLEAIKRVLTDEKYYEGNMYHQFLNSNLKNQNVEFTKRELDVLLLILDEKTSAEIGLELKISPHTVEGHRRNLLQKTNSKNVVGLIKYSINNNLF